MGSTSARKLWVGAGGTTILGSKKEKQKRITLRQEDVRSIGEEKVDVLAAQNFSFWIFKTRPEMLEYFKIAHANIADKGIMVMDMMGGGDCLIEDHNDK